MQFRGRTILGIVLLSCGMALAEDPRLELPAPPAGIVEPALPINLPTALQLAHARPLDIALASQRLRVASAELERSRVLWLPTLQFGPDYYRHDGRIQDIRGITFEASKSAFQVGLSPTAIFAVTDAIYAPLAARQVEQARAAEVQAATNNSLLAVAEAYFAVQQARGELAGAEDTRKRAEELVRRAELLAPGLAPPLEASRARAELARRRQLAVVAKERWRVASADLLRALNLDPGVLALPLEPPELRVTLLSADITLEELIPVGLTYRPELAASQALVQATMERLKAERVRPLVPSVLLRGAATTPAGTLGTSVFGGGRNDFVGNFGMRNDYDVQLLWELQNLGLGNRARVEEKRGEQQLAAIEVLRTQNRIAAEVTQAHAQLQSAAMRMGDAESGLKDALDSAEMNLEGLSQTKRLAGNLLILVVRPQEVVAAIQALGQAYNDYYGVIADYNRSQFRLYRALGHPAQMVGANVVRPLTTAP